MKFVQEGNKKEIFMEEKIILFVVPIVISLIIFVFAKRKRLVIYICCVLTMISCIVLFKINKEHVIRDYTDYRNYYLPFIKIPFKFFLTKTDTLDVLSENGYIVTVFDNYLMTDINWFESEAKLVFEFTEEDYLFSAMYMKPLGNSNHGLSDEEADNLAKNILEYLNSYYGKSYPLLEYNYHILLESDNHSVIFCYERSMGICVFWEIYDFVQKIDQ